MQGTSLPRACQVNGSDLKLNGLGVRKATFLKVNVYVAALYVLQPGAIQAAHRVRHAQGWFCSSRAQRGCRGSAQRLW